MGSVIWDQKEQSHPQKSFHPGHILQYTYNQFAQDQSQGSPSPNQLIRIFACYAIIFIVSEDHSYIKLAKQIHIINLAQIIARMNK